MAPGKEKRDKEQNIKKQGGSTKIPKNKMKQEDKINEKSEFQRYSVQYLVSVVHTPG